MRIEVERMPFDECPTKLDGGSRRRRPGRIVVQRGRIFESSFKPALEAVATPSTACRAIASVPPPGKRLSAAGFGKVAPFSIE